MSLETQNIFYSILSKNIDTINKFKEINEYITEKNGIINLHEYDTFLCEINKINDLNELLETMEIINNCLLKLFRHRAPNSDQLDIVIMYYLNNSYNKCVAIFDELVKNQYVFYACHIKHFEQLGYKNCNYNVHIDNSFMELLSNDSNQELIKVINNVAIINVNQVCHYITCIKNANNFFAKHKAQINNLEILLKKCSVDNRIYEFLINANLQHIITPNLFYRIPPLTYCDSIIKQNANILFLFIMRKQGIQITEQHFLKFLYTYPKININKKQFFLEDDLDFLLPYAEKNIVEITKIKVQLFNHLGITPNIDTLLYCISTINIDLASEIMRKHNVNPTKRCLDLAIKNKCTNEFIFQILSYKITPDSETIECISCENKNLIALLQKHGLKISLNDIDVLLSKKIVLDDLSILGIEYDEDIYFMYYKYKCLTDDQLEKFTKISQIVNFRKMFLNKKLTEKGMLREMKKNNLHIDQYCISNVYFVNNRKLIKYLEERYHCSTSIMAQKKPIAYDILKNITPEIMIAEVERKC